jgi:hypothetical protein
LIYCHASQGGCIGGTLCRRDRSRPAGGTCCPEGLWPYSGVCKPLCSKTCDAPFLLNQETCECECMLVPNVCSVFQTLDPNKCACVCRSDVCKFGSQQQDPASCQCKCTSPFDCEPCQYCDVLTGLCEYSPSEFYYGSIAKPECCLPGGEYCCGGRRCCELAEPCCGGTCWPPGWECCGNGACPPRVRCCVGDNPDKWDCCGDGWDCCKGSGRVTCCERERSCCKDGFCIAGKNSCN